MTSLQDVKQTCALGTTLDGFRITHQLAIGGMATVHLGHRRVSGSFSQLAAIKLMHSHLATDPELVRMFLLEARILSNLNHPNVSRLLDFGKAGDSYYLAMELLRGETWASVLRALERKKVARPTVHSLTAYVLAQACEGLHAAHQASDDTGAPLSVVHRDVAPQNLHVGYDGSVRVLDFGVASVQQQEQRAARGLIEGRFAYMAPEQMSGEPVDARADVWSLGVVLRESLTGQRAFRRASDTETITAVMRGSLPAWPREVPAALRQVVDRALSHEPELRQASARELGAELTRFVALDASAVGIAELSDWMGRLFQPELEALRQLIREATSYGHAHAPLAARRARPTGVDDTSADFDWDDARQKAQHRLGASSEQVLSSVDLEEELSAADLEEELSAADLEEELSSADLDELSSLDLELGARPLSLPLSSCIPASRTQPSAGAHRPAHDTEPTRPAHAQVAAAAELERSGAFALASRLVIARPAQPTARPPGPLVERAAATHGQRARYGLAAGMLVACVWLALLVRRDSHNTASAASPSSSEALAMLGSVSSQRDASRRLLGAVTTSPLTPSNGTVLHAPAMAGKPLVIGRLPRALAARGPQASGPVARAPIVPPGTVFLSLERGWAEVYVGHRKLGSTQNKLELPAGAHTLRLLPMGHGPVQIAHVRVHPGQATRVRLALR